MARERTDLDLDFVPTAAPGAGLLKLGLMRRVGDREAAGEVATMPAGELAGVQHHAGELLLGDAQLDAAPGERRSIELAAPGLAGEPTDPRSGRLQRRNGPPVVSVETRSRSSADYAAAVASHARPGETTRSRRCAACSPKGDWETGGTATVPGRTFQGRSRDHEPRRSALEEHQTGKWR